MKKANTWIHNNALHFFAIWGHIFSSVITFQGSFKQRETQYMIHMILPSIKLNIQVWCMEGPNPQRIIVKML